MQHRSKSFASCYIFFSRKPISSTKLWRTGRSNKPEYLPGSILWPVPFRANSSVLKKCLAHARTRFRLDAGAAPGALRCSQWIEIASVRSTACVVAPVNTTEQHLEQNLRQMATISSLSVILCPKDKSKIKADAIYQSDRTSHNRRLAVSPFRIRWHSDDSASQIQSHHFLHAA